MNISDFLKIYKILINWFQTTSPTNKFSLRSETLLFLSSCPLSYSIGVFIYLIS